MTYTAGYRLFPILGSSYGYWVVCGGVLGCFNLWAGPGGGGGQVSK